jgi:hypothetical protein
VKPSSATHWFLSVAGILLLLLIVYARYYPLELPVELSQKAEARVESNQSAPESPTPPPKSHRTVEVVGYLEGSPVLVSKPLLEAYSELVEEATSDADAAFSLSIVLRECEHFLPPSELERISYSDIYTPEDVAFFRQKYERCIDLINFLGVENTKEAMLHYEQVAASYGSSLARTKIFLNQNNSPQPKPDRAAYDALYEGLAEAQDDPVLRREAINLAAKFYNIHASKLPLNFHEAEQYKRSIEDEAWFFLVREAANDGMLDTYQELLEQNYHAYEVEEIRATAWGYSQAIQDHNWEALGLEPTH